MKIVLVAAMGENGVIGRDGQMPWHLKSDLRHFRALTLDKPVVMGRKTFESIGKPLDRRTNIVITRDPKFAAEGVETAPNLKAALELARKDCLRRGSDETPGVGHTSGAVDASAARSSSSRPTIVNEVAARGRATMPGQGIKASTATRIVPMIAPST